MNMDKTRIQVIQQPNGLYKCKIRKEHFYITFGGDKYRSMDDALSLAKNMAWMAGGCPIYIMDNNGNIVEFEE